MNKHFTGFILPLLPPCLTLSLAPVVFRGVPSSLEHCDRDPVDVRAGRDRQLDRDYRVRGVGLGAVEVGASVPGAPVPHLQRHRSGRVGGVYQFDGVAASRDARVVADPVGDQRGLVDYRFGDPHLAG